MTIYGDTLADLLNATPGSIIRYDGQRNAAAQQQAIMAHLNHAAALNQQAAYANLGGLFSVQSSPPSRKKPQELQVWLEGLKARVELAEATGIPPSSAERAMWEQQAEAWSRQGY